MHRQDGGNGGGGSNPNSQRPGNNAGSRDGDGNGKHGNSDKPAADPNAIVNGGYVKLPTVAYPPASQDGGEEGTVKLSVLVEANGSVSEVKVTQSTGHQRLDAAAVRTARSAGYRPKSVNGTPVRSRFNTSYTFSLE